MNDTIPVKRLYRSRHDRVLAGVCGGLANYFTIDPVIVRLVFVALGLATGAGLIAYIVMAIVIPNNPRLDDPVDLAGDSATTATSTARDGYGGAILGWVLLGIGAVWLLSNLGWSFQWQLWWPLAFIGVGVAVLWRQLAR